MRVFFFLFLFPPFSGGLPRVNTRVFFSGQVSIYQEFVEKNKKRVLGFNFLGFLRDGFGVKEKNKVGTGGLCPTVTGTH
jgi:hypothetical protein